LVVIETERLVLRKFAVTDASFIFELLNSPKWLQYIGDRGIKSVSDAQDYLVNGPLKSYATYGFGLYLINLQNAGTPIGMCGLIKRNYLEDVDIGYALLPQYEGNGYAYEIASATAAYAFNELQLLKLAAITDLHNERSVKLLEKMGFIFKEKITVKTEELMLFYKDLNNVSKL